VSACAQMCTMNEACKMSNVKVSVTRVAPGAGADLDKRFLAPTVAPTVLEAWAFKGIPGSLKQKAWFLGLGVTKLYFCKNNKRMIIKRFGNLLEPLSFFFLSKNCRFARASAYFKSGGAR